MSLHTTHMGVYDVRYVGRVVRCQGRSNGEVVEKVHGGNMKPCWFCGHEPTLYSRYEGVIGQDITRWRVECPRCLQHTPDHKSQTVAIVEWNETQQAAQAEGRTWAITR